MSHTTPVNRASADINQHRLKQLKQLIPEAFAEGKIDFDKLRAALGNIVDDRPDRYTFTWAGKQNAIRLLQMPTTATLIPDLEESVNFDNTKNIFIEGENLEALKLLYKAYFGRVKLIYIDPPYNTGNDFIYPDDYRDSLKPYLQLTGQVDSNGNLLSSNPDTSGRYHSDWLSMMYSRLFLARQLLSDDGAIFVSIDDNEVQNLRQLLNEIFGEENFITTIIWQKVYAPKNSAKHFSEDHEYILCYAKNAVIWRPTLLPRTAEANARYINPDNDPRGVWKPDNILASLTSGQRGRQYQRTGESKNLYEVISPSGKRFLPSAGNCWRYSEERFKELDADNRIWWGEDGNNMPAIKRFLSEVRAGMIPQTLWKYDEVGHTQEASQELKALFPGLEGAAFPTPKPTRLMKRLLQVGTNTPEDLVLDFFAGSSTLGQAVHEFNVEEQKALRFILVQLPEPTPISELPTIADVGKERLRRVRDSIVADEDSAKDHRSDCGFRVFKLALSTFRSWSGISSDTSEEYTRTMELFADPITADADPAAVLWEVAIKEGFPLSSRIHYKQIGDNAVSNIKDEDTGKEFFICLDERISADIAINLGLSKSDLLVVRDIALDDTTAANLALQCRLKTI